MDAPDAAPLSVSVRTDRLPADVPLSVSVWTDRLPADAALSVSLWTDRLPDAAPLSVSVWTDRLPADAALSLTLPAAAARLTLRQLLLCRLFPPDAAGRAPVTARLNRRANPDLPAIYSALLTVAEQWRSGLCRLALYTGRGWGRPAHPDDPVAAHLRPPPLRQPSPGPNNAGLILTVRPNYRPLDWAVTQGYAADRELLLDWLQSCALLYFVDKHGCAPPSPADLAPSDPCRPVIAGLYRRRCLRSVAGGPSEIAPAGRRLIGALLSETEALIDNFDIFKDARWDADASAADFDSGHGADLRVAAMLAEGIDPVRAVFLLRLYDGTLDPYTGCWQRLVGDPACFDRLLEPVLNRVAPPPPDATLAAIIEDGYALLDARAAAAADCRAQDEILRRLRRQ